MDPYTETVIRFYTENPDEHRLSRGWGPLELERSKEIILRYISDGQKKVLDVGGGTGVYAAWLAELGHEVHLVDITPAHIAFARTKRKQIRSAEIGDARTLSWPDGSVDLVLLLGPLYHLPEARDRNRALAEARRILRPGGVAFVAAICRFAPLLASLVEGFFDDPAFYGILLRDLEDGQHRNTTDDPSRFTTAYFHRPEELVVEMQQAGFHGVDLLPVEGPCWLANGSQLKFGESWSKPDRREKLLALARTVEPDSMALAASPHILGIGRVSPSPAFNGQDGKLSIGIDKSAGGH
jgi:ubiquinone/menaquinone biosynthesis C-methylase UbiE